MDMTWVLVADASRARIFALEKTKHWKLRKELDYPPGREQGHDLVPNRGNSNQHNMEKTARGGLEPLTLHDSEAKRFAGQLADELEVSRAQGRFQDLVVVAPPKFLGMLRKEFEAPLANRVTATYAKDFSKLEPHQLSSAFERAAHSAA